MRQYLQSLSPRTEFAIVILGAFGMFFAGTFLTLISSHAPNRLTDSGTYSGAHLMALLVYEPAIMAVLLPFLRVRGWTLKRLGIRISAQDTLIGFALFLADLAITFSVYLAVLSFSPATDQAIHAWDVTPGGFGLALVVAVAIVNPIFEETFVCGYVISVLKDRADFWSAINISIAIRLLYHLYQGPGAVISIVPFGFLMAYWYARTGRLWPVMVAHGIADFLAFAGYVA